MNIKKYLKQCALKDVDVHITENDRLFYQQLTQQCEQSAKQEKPKGRKAKKDNANKS